MFIHVRIKNKFRYFHFLCAANFQNTYILNYCFHNFISCQNSLTTKGLEIIIFFCNINANTTFLLMYFINLIKIINNFIKQNMYKIYCIKFNIFLDLSCFCL